MEKASDRELTDFCLLLPPTGGSADHAGDAIRDRLTFLDERIRGDSSAAVADRVQNLVEHGSGNLIAVSLAVEADAIHGAVSEQGEPGEEGPESRFVVPLAARA